MKRAVMQQVLFTAGRSEMMEKIVEIEHINKLRDIEKEHESSCRFCSQGIGVYRCKNDKGEIFWVCEKHKDYILKEYKRE